MQDALKHLEGEYVKMQVGRASTAMVEGLLITAYGMTQPLRNIASITTPDAKSIMIQPWDKSVLSSIESGIRERSDLGLNPMNDGNVLRINLPQPTEERRKELVKVAYAKAEEAKVSIRNARHKVHSAIKDQLKEKEVSEDEAKAMESELQEVVDAMNKKIDELAKSKEKDILTV
ncbi:MAG: ribosome recycling factor [Candidatus Altimarinota bacterium]